MQEVKDLIKWKDIPCSWIGRFNVVKITQNNLQSQYNFYHNSNNLFLKEWKADPQMHMEFQEPKYQKHILNKKGQSLRTHIF